MTLATAQRALESRRAQLRQRLGLGAVGEARGPGDQADEAAERTSLDLVFMNQERLAYNLREVDDALARIAAGRFGLCEECRAAIPAPRLRVQPWAARCAPCQAQVEQEAARTAGMGRPGLAGEPEANGSDASPPPDLSDVGPLDLEDDDRC